MSNWRNRFSRHDKVWQDRVRRALKGNLSQRELQEAARLTEEWKEEYIVSDRRLIAFEVQDRIMSGGAPTFTFSAGTLTETMLAMNKRRSETSPFDRVFVNHEDSGLPRSALSAYISARCKDEKLEGILRSTTQPPKLPSPSMDERVGSNESAPATADEGSNSAIEP